MLGLVLLVMPFLISFFDLTDYSSYVKTLPLL
jgi:hypothetical protein